MHVTLTIYSLIPALLTLIGKSAAETLVQVNPDAGLLKDCNGNCKSKGGQFGVWTQWKACEEGDCHLEYGTQTRQNYCFVRVTKYSRSDGGSRHASSSDWEEICRETEQRKCVRKQSCSGEWGKWGSWTECTKERQDSFCGRTRRRNCLDHNRNRLSGSHCYGGTANDTLSEGCKENACMERSVVQEVVPEEVQSANPKPSVEFGNNTIIIISVAIGSVVFGAIFVLLLMNVIRRASGSNDERSSSRGDIWKRIGSVNTSSTGYSAGYVTSPDATSPAPELRNVQSPGSTLGSGSSNGSQAHFFSRNEGVHIPQGETSSARGLLTVSGGLNAKEKEERPRRSRLLQENIYWEITDQLAREEISSGSEDGDDTQEQQDNSQRTSNNRREVVQNVLYGSMV